MALGLVVLTIGIVPYIYPQLESVFGITVTVGYPYLYLGAAFMVSGFVVLFEGAVMGQEATKRLPVQPQPITTVRPSKYCANCGFSLGPADVYCPRCQQKAAYSPA